MAAICPDSCWTVAFRAAGRYTAGVNVCEVCRTAYVLAPPGAFGCQCGKYAPGPSATQTPPLTSLSLSSDGADFPDPAPLGRSSDWLPDAPDL